MNTNPTIDAAEIAAVLSLQETTAAAGSDGHEGYISSFSIDLCMHTKYPTTV
ncbi:hypothetical protein [Kitasatospora griseola]|uniref:hypothetical protein n=1 Tax=Kitasatospora griseola TaxID=2064 RepID=UPI00382910F1